MLLSLLMHINRNKRMASSITLRAVIILGTMKIACTASQGVTTSKAFLLSLVRNNILLSWVGHLVAQRYGKALIKNQRGILPYLELSFCSIPFNF